MIRAEGVTARDGQRVLFRDLTWEMREGESWAAIGGNASGKTALARLLSGRLLVVSGTMRYRLDAGASQSEDPATDLPPDGAISVVSIDEEHRWIEAESPYFQARWNSLEDDRGPRVRDLLSHESIHEINPYRIDAPPAPGLRAHLRKARAAARLMGIEGLLGRRVIQLSAGERRKLLITRALLREPRVLILDGPFAGLDPPSRRALLASLDLLIVSGVQFLLLTSRTDEIPARTTHLLVLRRCRIIAAGPRRSVELHARVSMDVRGAGLRSRALGPPRGSRALARRPGAPLFALHGVRIAYGGIVVLRDVSWTARAGENWMVTGPNGSGKSTLLALLAGDHPQAYANDVSILGRRRGSGETIWDIKARVALVAPQLSAYFPPGLDCVQVVATGMDETFGLAREPSGAVARRAVAWLQALGLGRIARLPLRAISEGERVLVLLARALIREPDLLLLDEPCQGLDAGARRGVFALLDRLSRRRGISYVYVTHHPEERPETVTHALELGSGRVRRASRISRFSEGELLSRGV